MAISVAASSSVSLFVSTRCFSLPYLPPRSFGRSSLTLPLKFVSGNGLKKCELLKTKASSEETSTSIDTSELITDLKEKWDGLENKSTVLLYGGGAIIAVWLSSIVVGAINSVPLLPKVMELVGLGYTGWFVYRYLLFKTANSPYQYRGIAHALSTVLREEGPRALYHGWLPSVIGVVPYVGLNFAVYESLKDWLVKDNPFGLVENNELTIITRLTCGAIAGTVGQTIAYPLDVIRRRMQMVGWKDASSVVTGEGRSKASLEYTGMIDAFRKTVRHEGVGALYKGLVPNSVKVVPSIAIAFVTYEMVKDVLGVEFRISD